MKTTSLKYLVCIGLCVVMISCGDDDDDDSTSIVGQWQSETFSTRDCDSGGLEITGFPCPGCFENNFRADGTFTTTITIPGELSESVSGTYTVTASELTTCPEGTSTCETSTYSIDGDTLAITSEDDGCTLEVNLIRA